MNANLPSGWTPGTVVVKSDPEKATAKVAQAAARAEQRANQALAQNDDIAASNERIISVLRTATGKDFGSDAIAWFNWWNDYNEYDQAAKAAHAICPRRIPIARRTRWRRFAACAALRPAWPNASAEGTILVLSPARRCGPFRADADRKGHKPGEWVLSQNPETGELAYKPVT